MRRIYLKVRRWVLLIGYWFMPKRKPGLPSDARPKYEAYETRNSYKDQMEFIKRIYKIELPEMKNEKEWRSFVSGGKLDLLIDKSETLTRDEIEKHEVKDWDYLTKGMDEGFLEMIADQMMPHLKKDGDVCLLPAHLFPDSKMGLMNVRGKIKPFVAKDGSEPNKAVEEALRRRLETRRLQAQRRNLRGQ